MPTTDRSTIIGGTRSPQGYWSLSLGPGETRRPRAEFIGHPPADLGISLFAVAHLSDLHLCDSQSPARADFLDRWADDDSPLKPLIDQIGTYRAQECLTVQVGEAMIRAVNAVQAGPVGGAPLDWAITTGDVTDNAHTNELSWYITLLNGGPLDPDSGDRSRYEGSADHDHWNEAYWHPDPSQVHGPDRPHRLHGFPDVPGLLDAVRQPFQASGLRMPWLAVHGNHDQLIQGTVPAVGAIGDSTSGTRAIDVPPEWTLEQIARFCAGVDACDPAALELWPQLLTRDITPDPLRRIVTRADFVDAHFEGGSPLGHGFPESSRSTGRAYYRYDHGQVSVLVLDTVNEYGGWQGSIDEEQWAWLRAELSAADAEQRYIVLASHHTSADLVNGTAPADASRRILGEEFAAAISGHRCLILWLNGHTHITRVTAHPGDNPWWEVTAPSLIDFPQQGRIVELLRSTDGILTIATTMLDHDGEAPWTGTIDSITGMAGLARELAANDWQWRVDDLGNHTRAGTAADRNLLLHLADPFA